MITFERKTIFVKVPLFLVMRILQSRSAHHLKSHWRVLPSLDTNKTNINHNRCPHNMMSTTFNIVHMSSCRNSRCTISSTYWIEPTGKWSEDRYSYRRQHRSHLLLYSSDQSTWGRIDFVTIIHVGDHIGVNSWSINPAIDQLKEEFDFVRVLLGRGGRLSDLLHSRGIGDKHGLCLLELVRLRPPVHAIHPICKSAFRLEQPPISHTAPILHFVHGLLLRRQGVELLIHLHGGVHQRFRDAVIHHLAIQ